MLVFGGAIENNGESFVTTNDSYLLTMDNLTWTKLESDLTRHWNHSLPTSCSLHVSD